MKNVIAAVVPRVIAPIYGAGVVYKEWLRAIGTYSSFRKCHIYCHVKDVERLQHAFAALPTLAVFPLEVLPKNLRRHQYETVICRGLRSTASVCAVRNAIGGISAPVCSITTTLSYYSCLIDMFHNMIACNAQIDSFFCGTRAARTALVRLIQNLNGSPTTGHAPLSEDNVVLMPHGIDFERFAHLPPKALCRAHFGIPQDAAVMLSVGRLSLYDKIDYRVLLDAFALLRNRKPGEPSQPVHLVIAGDNKERGAEFITRHADQLGIRSDVTIISSFLEEQKPMLYGAADLFLSLANSVQESFGLTILEAMASGLPVIATDWNGYRELLTDGKHGYLVTTRWKGNLNRLKLLSPILSTEESHRLLSEAVQVDPTEVADKLERLWRHPDMRSRMAAEAREHAKQFSWPGIVKAAEAYWRDAYSNAVKQPRSRPAPSWLLLDYQKVFSDYPSKRSRRDTAANVPQKIEPEIADACPELCRDKEADRCEGKGQVAGHER